MHTDTVITNVINFITANFDTYSSIKLQKVYRGDVEKVLSFPSAAVQPVNKAWDKSSQSSRYNETIGLDILIYGFNVFKEENVQQITQLSEAMADMFKSDQKLGNTVNLLYLSNCEYGVYLKRGLTGETYVMGSALRIYVQMFGEP